MEDDPRVILSPDVFFDLCKSEEGKRKVQLVMRTARVAMSVQSILDYLNELGVFSRQLSPDEMQNMCDISYYGNYQATHSVVLDYVNSIPIGEHDCAGSC